MSLTFMKENLLRSYRGYGADQLNILMYYPLDNESPIYLIDFIINDHS